MRLTESRARCQRTAEPVKRAAAARPAPLRIRLGRSSNNNITNIIIQCNYNAVQTRKWDNFGLPWRMCWCLHRWRVLYICQSFCITTEISNLFASHRHTVVINVFCSFFPKFWYLVLLYSRPTLCWLATSEWSVGPAHRDVYKGAGIDSLTLGRST